MNADQRLLDHVEHTIRVWHLEEDGKTYLDCDTCGETIIEQYDDGMVLWG